MDHQRTNCHVLSVMESCFFYREQQLSLVKHFRLYTLRFFFTMTICLQTRKPKWPLNYDKLNGNLRIGWGWREKICRNGIRGGGVHGITEEGLQWCVCADVVALSGMKTMKLMDARRDCLPQQLTQLNQMHLFVTSGRRGSRVATGISVTSRHIHIKILYQMIYENLLNQSLSPGSSRLYRLVPSIMWEFRGLKMPRNREMSGRSYALDSTTLRASDDIIDYWLSTRRYNRLLATLLETG